MLATLTIQSQIATQSSKLSDIAGAKDYDPYASLVTGLGYNSSVKGAWSLGTTAAYTKPESNPPVFDELQAIPSTKDTLALTNLSSLANEGNTPPLYVVISLLNMIFHMM